MAGWGRVGLEVLRGNGMGVEEFLVEGCLFEPVNCLENWIGSDMFITMIKRSTLSH